MGEKELDVEQKFKSLGLEVGGGTGTGDSVAEGDVRGGGTRHGQGGLR